MANEGDRIDPIVARRIIEKVGNVGEPPEYGFKEFTVGLEDYLNVIDEEYLKTFIKDGDRHIWGWKNTLFILCEGVSMELSLYSIIHNTEF